MKDIIRDCREKEKDYAVYQQPEGEFYKRVDFAALEKQLDTNEAKLLKELEPTINFIYQDIENLYDEMLKAGVAKECARGILPLNTPTRLYMAGSVRSWIHYIDLRSANGTQKEHQEIALAAKDILFECLPNIAAAAFNQHD